MTAKASLMAKGYRGPMPKGEVTGASKRIDANPAVKYYTVEWGGPFAGGDWASLYDSVRYCATDEALCHISVDDV